MTSITVTPPDISLAAGTKQQYTAIGHFSDNSTEDLTHQVFWDANPKPNTVTIDPHGLLTAVAPGTANVAAAVGSIVGGTNVTVTAATLTSVTVTPADITLAAGTTRQFTATGHYSDGSAQNLTSTAVWSVNPSSVAVSDLHGFVTALAHGAASVSASAGPSFTTGGTGLTVQ